MKAGHLIEHVPLSKYLKVYYTAKDLHCKSNDWFLYEMQEWVEMC